MERGSDSGRAANEWKFDGKQNCRGPAGTEVLSATTKTREKQAKGRQAARGRAQRNPSGHSPGCQCTKESGRSVLYLGLPLELGLVLCQSVGLCSGNSSSVDGLETFEVEGLDLRRQVQPVWRSEQCRPGKQYQQLHR